MSTQKETIDFILARLRDPERFSVRKMFGEYALYCEGKVVALVCDDRFYVKIVPASSELEPLCEKGEPYPGARLYYLIEEGQLGTLVNLPFILATIAASLPKKKAGKQKRSRTANPR